MSSPADAALLAAAGALAAIVGTAGGITSLVSYPILLLAGVPAVPANVANIVALTACWPGSALASRPELQGRGSWLGRWALMAAAGGIAGSLGAEIRQRAFQGVSASFDRLRVVFSYAGTDLGEKSRGFGQEELYKLMKELEVVFDSGEQDSAVEHGTCRVEGDR